MEVILKNSKELEVYCRHQFSTLQYEFVQITEFFSGMEAQKTKIQIRTLEEIAIDAPSSNSIFARNILEKTAVKVIEGTSSSSFMSAQRILRIYSKKVFDDLS